MKVSEYIKKLEEKLTPELEAKHKGITKEARIMIDKAKLGIKYEGDKEIPQHMMKDLKKEAKTWGIDLEG